MSLKILESAIADVGYWSWWTGDVDSVIQIEFGGVQLWSPPLAEGKPPNGQIALRFDAPSFVAFLTRTTGDDTPASTWPEMMQRDELGNLGVDEDQFTLTDTGRLREMLDSAAAVDVRVGNRSTVDRIPEGASIAGMWAGAVGIIVVADSLRILNHAGEIDVNQIASLHNKWWEYWKSYWKSKDTESPMPRDYACEVTIPIGWD